jgi:hypothetical protein
MLGFKERCRYIGGARESRENLTVGSRCLSRHYGSPFCFWTVSEQNGALTTRG